MKWLGAARTQQPTELRGLADRLGALATILPRIAAPPPARFVRRSVTAGGGHFLFGPRFDLAPGAYFVLLWLDIGAGVASPRLVFDAVAWDQDRPSALADRDYRLASGESRITLLTLRFELAVAQSVELRAWSDVPMNGANLLGLDIHRVNEALLRGDPDIAWATAKPRTEKNKGRAPEALVGGGSEQYRPLELWLAFDPVLAGSAIFTLHPTRGETTTIELLDATAGTAFTLADGRSLFHLTFPSEAARGIFGECQVTAKLDEARADFGIVMIPALPPLDATRPAYRTRLAAGDSHSSATVRLRGWALDNVAQQQPLGFRPHSGEQSETEITLSAGETIEFAPSQRALFIFEAGPDCGVVECRWGTQNHAIDLAAATPGLRSIAVPEDFAPHALGPDRATARTPSLDSKIEIFALGSGSAASQGTEVMIQSLWQNYPLARASLTELELIGTYEAGTRQTILSQGSASLATGDMPAIQFARHERGGLAAIRHRGRVIPVDLYAARRDSILVLPSLEQPILSPATLDSALAGDTVHPALRHLFRRMRPAWLKAQPETGARGASDGA